MYVSVDEYTMESRVIETPSNLICTVNPVHVPEPEKKGLFESVTVM